jgi:hypothetical protein
MNPAGFGDEASNLGARPWDKQDCCLLYLLYFKPNRSLYRLRFERGALVVFWFHQRTDCSAGSNKRNILSLTTCPDVSAVKCHGILFDFQIVFHLVDCFGYRKI